MTRKLISFYLVLGLIFTMFCASTSVSVSANSNEYYVATDGNDANPGTILAPFKTIQKAADTAQPGDTIYVRGGTYRELVAPSRGGTGEDKRITYKAYPGETPVIKGSEQITKWKSKGKGVWEVKLADSFFGNYNPYVLTITGEWLLFGNETHLGDVYLNGKCFTEVHSAKGVSNSINTWYTSNDGKQTTILANFGKADPNKELAEINVRECVFFPSVTGLAYITVEGFTMMQAASQWAAPQSFQKGVLGTAKGYKWIIQNCHITDGKCVGIVSGKTPDGAKADITKYGSNIVRNNTIERCGEAGIAGSTGGFTASLIEGNLIQDINCQGLFGGEETAGIKVHGTVDLVIKDNIIRRVHNGKGDRLMPGHFSGIWIDYNDQGTRITGNVIYDIDEHILNIEGNHGPILIDNNVFAGYPVDSASERVIFAHNLFVNSGHIYVEQDRSAAYWVPHTTTMLSQTKMAKIGDRYYNNIYIDQGTDKYFDLLDSSPDPANPVDFKAGYNVYYQGANKLKWDDTGLIKSDFNANFSLKDLPEGVEISFDADSSPQDVKCPLVSYDFIGVYSFVDQGMEDVNGNPISIDNDLEGKVRNAGQPKAGPFEDIKTGKNTFTKTAGAGVLTATDYAITRSAYLPMLEKNYVNIAKGKKVKVSSHDGNKGSTLTDGNFYFLTSWGSLKGWGRQQNADVDLGAKSNISKIRLYWGMAYATEYVIQISDDGKRWTKVYSSDTTGVYGGAEEITLRPSVSARYVRLYMTQPSIHYDQIYSLIEFEVYDSGERLTISQVDKNDTYVTGTAKIYTKISVKKGSKTLGSANVDKSGKFKVKIPVQKAGTELSVIAANSSGSLSRTVKIKVK